MWLVLATDCSPGRGTDDHIESVQIDVPETLDVGTRSAFYDATGAILDMLVTHLFQLAGEVAMRHPALPQRRAHRRGPRAASSDISAR